MTRPLRVFLCHASQDKPAVRKLHRYLKQHGIEPWLDEIDLLPGENWEVEIPRALNASDVILVCLSKNSINKEGYVQKEISFALDKALEKPDGTIFIIPAKLEDCEVPNRLNRYQWVDLFRPDSNKRLLLGLNKRALSLGSDVSPVTVDDTRQKKSAITKPVVNSDQLNRDVIEASLEIAEKEAIEKALLENVARETAEKAELERLVLEAKEKSKNEAVERKLREKRERELKEKVVSDGRRKKQRELTGSIFKLVFSNLRLFGIGSVILFVLFFVVFGLNYLINNLPVPTFPNSSRTVATATVSSPKATATIKPPTLTSVPFTPTPQPTKTPIPTSTLGIGSTMIGEKGETLVYVPASEFTMGSDVKSNEQPTHTVFLDAFWIDQAEVTNKQYKACVDAGKCKPPSSERSNSHENYYGNPEFDDYPIIYVNWDKANLYCEVWTGGDLPTEAQWEKAARGTDARTYPWGEGISCNKANYLDGGNYCVGDTSAVGSYENSKSIYGAFDMSGNVWEWVNDWYDVYPGGDPTVSIDFGEKYRVMRGGSWNYDYYIARSAYRGMYEPSKPSYSIGFRCARSP